MNVTFGNETYNVRRVVLMPQYIKCGDFVEYNGEVTKVITIQRDCPAIDHQRRFTMFTLATRDNHIIPARNLVGNRVVYKKNRTVFSH